MKRCLAAWLLTAGALCGQFAFYSGGERLENAYQVGSVPAGGWAEARLRVVNLGTAPATLESLSLSGAGFALAGAPRLPLAVAPGTAVEFTVRFEPEAPGAYSAGLRAGDASLILLGAATPAAQVYLDYGGVLRLLAGAAVVDFGVVERGVPVTRNFVLRNPPDQSAVAARLAVEGAGFRLAAPAGVQMMLAPGETARFQVLAEPAAAGPREAVLLVDGRRFTLRATAVDPPLPRPELAVELPAARSLQQGRVSVKLAAPSGTRAAGEIRLVFLPAAPGGPGDPAVVFATGARTARFSIEPGDSAARFDGRPYIEFQTGSTAGTISLTLELERFTDQKSLLIPPAPVGFSSTRALRNGTALDVEAAGFDNTRSVSRLAFTFYDRGGAVIPPGAIRLDAAADFRRYFDGSDLGGQFALRARFPVTGDAAAIQSVDVEISNSSGTTRSARLPLN